MAKIKILIVGVFGDIEDFNNNDRLNNIIRYGQRIGEVTLLTSSYSHKYKRGRGEIRIDNLKVHFIPTLAYTSNVSLKRFLSHFLLGILATPKLWRLIGTVDFVYALSPPITMPVLAIIIARFKGKKVGVDFTDLWPQAFGLIGGKGVLQFLSFPLLIPQFIILKFSDLRIAINSIYKKELERNIGKKVDVVPLGLNSNLLRLEDSNFDDLEKIKINTKEKCIFCFGGNIGSAYNFDLMIHIVNQFNQLCHPAYFIVVGDGVDRIKLEDKLLKFCDVPWNITGRKSHDEYLSILRVCDFGFNLYKPTKFISTSYKLYDYLASEVWIINNLIGDAETLVSDNVLGVNIAATSDLTDLEKIYELYLVDVELKTNRFKKTQFYLNQEFLSDEWKNLVTPYLVNNSFGRS